MITSVTNTKALNESTFRRKMWIVTWVTLLLPPITGIFLLSFVGIFPFPEVFYPFTDYAAIVVLCAIVIGIYIFKGFTNQIIQIAASPESHQAYLLKLEKLPLYYFSVLFLYFAIGLIATLYSLSTLHGFNYPPEKYLTSYLGIIPGGLITAFPIFFYLTDTLGRYLAPLGIHTSVAPVKLKLIVLGIFVPVFIDTLLIIYFYDRTGYFSVETIGIWFFLILIAGIGSYMAWQSFRQSLSPFVNALAGGQGDHKNVTITPQSLDELGLLSQQWHDLWRKVLDYEKYIADINVALQGDIEQRTQELESERLFIDKVLDNAGALVLVLNRHGHIVRFNPACEKITGFSFSDLYNQPIWEWLIPPEQLEDIKSVFNNLTDEGMDSQYENDIMKRDGGRVLIAWNNSTIRNDTGKVEYIVSIGIDISERQAAQEALQEAKEVAEQASLAKSEFLSHMSHELRTPMNAILGFAQLLELDDNLQSEQKESVGEILHAGHHLLELINEVLDLAKIESGKLELDIKKISIASVVNDSIHLFENMAKQHNVKLINNIPDDKDYFVLADRLRFKQVFINVLSNAIKYNVENGTVNIDVNQLNRDRVCLSIRDTGTGIPADMLDKLFMPFERLVNQKDTFIEGTGVGLALSGRLVELMKGNIEVDSVENQGSTFSIVLPVSGI